MSAHRLIVAPTRGHADIHAQNEGLEKGHYTPVTHPRQLDGVRGGTLEVLAYPFGPDGWALRDAVAAYRERHANH